MGGILAPRGNWVGLVEAIHDPIADDQRWAERIWEASKPLFRTSHGVGVSVMDHDERCSSARYRALAMVLGAERFAVEADTGLAVLGVEGFRAFYYPAGLLATHIEIERGLPAALTANSEAFRRAHGVADALGVFSHPRAGRVATLFALHDRPIVLTRHEREVLTRVALHIESAHRLRSTPEVVKAVIDPDGRVRHREADAPPAAALTERVSRLSASASPLDVWPALVAGKASLVRRRVKGKVSYLLLENPPERHALRAWSNEEIEVVTQAARGLSTKHVSYALGISPATASLRLASAAAKVGTSTHAELVRVAAMLTRDPRAPFPEVSLTAAEREVLALLQQGLSNRQIAQQRSRSLRTIANQVASLLRKSQHGSRRGLLVEPAADARASVRGG